MTISDIYPEIMQANTAEGHYMGVAVQGGHPRYMYLWRGHPPAELPQDPCFLEPVGGRPKFWASKPVVWNGMYPAICGLTSICNRKVPVYDYLRLLSLVRDYVGGVSNRDDEHEVFSIVRRLSAENHRGRTPVILYTPTVQTEDLQPTKSAPVDGKIIPPPKLS